MEKNNEKKNKEKKNNTVKKNSGKKRSVFRRVVKLMIIFAILMFITGLGAFIYLYYTTDKVDIDDLYDRIEKSSVLYDSEGHEIDTLYYDENRELVTINQIPEVTQHAFIAIEDKTFYKHHGFNFTRMAGAVINTLIGRSSEISGTSTITQQLARNVYLADIKSERTIGRKITEMVYAVKLENAMSKDEILEAYLNTIYLGYGSYGIESAANTYFSKHTSKLNLAESAALAALPQAPDSYALLRDEKGEATKYMKKYDVYANDLSKERRNMVLDLMVEQGYATAEEADDARKSIKKILKPGFEKVSESEYSYFTDYVVNTVAEDLASEYSMSKDEALRKVYTGGLHIYTTVDPEIQKIVNEEFSNDYNFPYSSEKPQAAMVITDVETGRIEAMVGGRGASGRKLFNRAISARQPGSSIKPLAVYSAALQKSFEYEKEGRKFPFVDYGIDRQGISGWGDYITAGSRVTDEPLRIDGQVWPQNFSRSFTGYRTFRTALQQSINTCAVKIQLQVGADYSMKMLKKYGITTAVDDSSKATNDLNPAAMALGAMTYGVTPLEMALAYGTFPNGGKRNSAICYTEILDSEGKRILEKVPVQTQVLDEGVAYVMTDVLKSVVSRGIAGNASIYGTQVGGKTGTTNDTYDIWFCGFTPLYSAALWIGTDHNVQMGGTSTQAAYLWSKIMRQIPDITDGEYKEMPSDVVYRNGEYYTSGTEPYAGYYNSRNSWGYNNYGNGTNNYGNGTNTYGNGTGGWRRY